ncbi:STYKc [Musa troglodytarum]|uniref:non-specific serine/threonine protein kinase n=1 Tax=Musa troglodytarum TaxID=320322 RepID=A0A9E7HQE8_9LILI|nr:STYKc [Musa troglodytarum]
MASPFRPPLLLLLPTLRHIPPPPAAGRGEGPIAAAPTVGAPLATHRLLLALGNGLVASPVLGGAGVGRVQVLLAVERGRNCAFRNMSSPNTALAEHLSQKIGPFGLKMWEMIGISFGVLLFCALLLLVMCVWIQNRRRYRRASGYLPTTQIPAFSRDIKEVPVEKSIKDDSALLRIYDGYSDNDSNKGADISKLEHGDSNSDSDSFRYVEKDTSSKSAEAGSTEIVDGNRQHSAHPLVAPSQFSGLPEFSHLGWGHWFTLRDLQIATNWFSKDNVLGEGGYGIVYRGQLVNGTPVAIKRLLNNLGQAEKEFRVEVEAIGHVRHKNLVRLLGYCVEGTQRMLVYEYVNNGNLEQWLHGAMRERGSLTWDARMKIILGTAKALAYLHDAVEPKVVHRDIKSSNILIDEDFNAKVSDFGLAKLLGAGKSHIATRVNLVDWLKWMIGNRRSEEVVDPGIVTRPSTKALKKALLTALRCVDPDSEKRPTMGRVVRMLEPDNPKPHQVSTALKGGIGQAQRTRVHSPGPSPGWPDRVFSRGCSALTTILMFGLKSASYCTHKAATAANCSHKMKTH